MSRSTLAAGLRHLRGVMAAQRSRDDSDEQLLHAFANQRDEAAFAVLVRRHGPMVLHVCRRVLGHRQDAEDAFQATFLVLARNAATLRNKAALAGFLHGTAYRLSLSAKRAAARRRKHEEQTPARCSADPADELSWREVWTLLDAEIARLPDSLRSVLILCCLENLSQAEAGRRLGLKERTVSNRLAAARQRLSQRLTRRGVELTVMLAAASLATPSASALPAGLLASTLEAVLATAAGDGLTGVVSASVAELVQNATTAIIVSKAKTAVVVLLAVSLLAVATSGSLVFWYERASGPLAAAPERPAAKSDDKPKAASPQRAAAKGMEIQGRILDPEGKPKAGAKLLLLTHGANRKVTPLGVSAADGRFTVFVSQVKTDELMPALIAQAEGAGMDFLDLAQWKPEKSVELRLVKDRAIRGRVVNTEGKPVAGVRVTLDNLGIGPGKSMDSFLLRWKKKPFNTALPNGIQLMVPGKRGHGKAALFEATTNAEGRFVLHGLGEERFVWLYLSGGGIAAQDLLIVNRGDFDAKPYNQATLDNIPKEMEDIAQRRMLHGSDVSVVAEAEKVIGGIVKDADNGAGRPNTVVYLSPSRSRQVYQPLLQATTDAQGRYQIRGAGKAKSYTLDVLGDATAGYMQRRLEVADTAGYQPISADITVKKGAIIAGKIIDRATGKPIRGFVEAAVLAGNPFAKDYPPFDISAWFGRWDTDADGNFRVVAIPGPVLLMGGPSDSKAGYLFKSPLPDAKYPDYFDNSLGPDFPCLIDFHGGSRPIQGKFCKVLEIKPNAKVVKQDIVLERASALAVRIQDAQGKPLADVWVAGSTVQHSYPIQCREAECSAYQIEPGKPRLMAFYHRERKLAGMLTLKGDEKPPVAMTLAPTGALKGRLLDTDGKPLADVIIEPRYHDRQSEGIDRFIHEAKQIVTDTRGNFRLDELIPRSKFELSFRRGKRRFERATKAAEATIQVQPGECRDLGTIKLKALTE